MSWDMLDFIDMIGTIAFAISGAFVGVRKEMDLFGINMVAVTTACGGGVLRDLIVDSTPPLMFTNPFYVAVAAVCANAVFLLLKRHRHMPARLVPVYDRTLFWFDTLGLAAFAVDGVMIGVQQGYGDNLFFLSFLGFLTGVGGGVLRDVLSDQIPDIFRKHIYALAAIAGALVTGGMLKYGAAARPAMTAGFFTVLLLRVLAAHYRWNLPKIEAEARN